MSLIIVFHNDFKDNGPLPDDSSYDVTALVGDGGPRSKTIYKGRIEHHKRGDGWLELVSKLVEQERDATAYLPPSFG